MLLPGVRACPEPLCQGWSPGAGGIAKGFRAHSASSMPVWAAPGSRTVLWEPMAGAGAA